MSDLEHEVGSSLRRLPLLCRYVRHPIMLGFVIAFWATPVMTMGPLLFAVVTTAYILVAIRLEERDLVKVHGDQYREYQRQMSMLIPWPKRSWRTDRYAHRPLQLEVLPVSLTNRV